MLLPLITLLLVGCTPLAPLATGPVQIPAGWTTLIGGMGPLPGSHPVGPGGAPPQPGLHPQGPPPQGPPPQGPAPANMGPPRLWTWHGGTRTPIKVAVDAFEIDRTEVTRAAYKQFLDATGYRPPYVDEAWAGPGGEWGQFNWSGTDYPEGTGDHPVVLVSWYDARAYCQWRGARLPTEGEWQRAALGEDRAWPWGEAYSGDRLNHGQMQSPFTEDSDGWTTTSPVGSFPSGDTPEGAHDLFGDAWEFTADFRRDDWSLTQRTPVAGGYTDVHSPAPGLYVAVRGGSYFFDLVPNPQGERNQFLVEIRRKTSGFRCAQ